MPALILIVEDDPTLAAITAGYLESAEMTTEVVSSGREMMRRLHASVYALILLDLGLPDEDGLALLRKLRGWVDAPVMVVTARDGIDARLVAFELGAQDVLSKPYDPRELRFRVMNLLRRQPRNAVAPHAWHIDDWHIDLHARTARSSRTDEEAALTRTEFDLLVFLLRGGGRVYSRAQLIDAVSGASDPESERAIDILVSRLRRKLAADGGGTHLRLQTVRGVGYRLRLGDDRLA